MNGNHLNEEWKKVFGEVWDRLIKVHANIGGFLMLHKEKAVKLDGNSMRLMGFTDRPDYDALLQQLDWLKGHSGSYAHVRFETIISNEEVEAGFISMEARQEVSISGGLLPVVSQDELISLMGNDDRRKLLLLVKLTGIETMSLLPCYIFSAINAINAGISDDSVIGRHNETEYWVYIPEPDIDAASVIENLRRAVKESHLTDEFGFVISAETGMDLCVGAALIEGAAPAKLMHAANYALFVAHSKGEGGYALVENDNDLLDGFEFSRINNFARLIDHNLFRYHFQPIVSAYTGEIVAYEALMRTDSDIGLNPLEILDLAAKYNRLYDIEHATLFNTMAQLGANQDVFENRRLFINIIPSQLLSDSDYNELKARYGELWEKVVLEMTEQIEIPDEQIKDILARYRDNGVQIAIDDYGTGYSNTSKLIAVNPEYVKLDRSLISDINKDKKKQAIIQGLVDYIHLYGGQVLGEGVETYEELATLIDLGCDLFQGYYISRPKPVLLSEISEKVREEIEHINLEVGSDIKRAHVAKEGEVTNLVELAKKRITDIIVGNGNYVLSGEGRQAAKNTIAIKENSVCEITIRNLVLQPESGRPAIALGEGSKVKLIFEGENIIRKQGIYVPESAGVEIGGPGSLTIFTENRDCYGIGNSCVNTHGRIVITSIGNLEIETNGEYCVGIGGGKSMEPIVIGGGIVKLKGAGSNCLGIGAMMGGAKVHLSHCGIYINHSSARTCGIGSLDGPAEVSLSNLTYENRSSSRYFCGIGSLDGKKVDIKGSELLIDISTKGKYIADLGCNGGECNCNIRSSTVKIYNEGENATAIGDAEGSGEVVLTDVALMIKMLSGNGFGCGSKETPAVFIRGSQEIDINS